jgi:hypothetical protein
MRSPYDHKVERRDEEVGCESVLAPSEAAEVFQPRKHSLDLVALVLDDELPEVCGFRAAPFSRQNVPSLSSRPIWSHESRLVAQG